MAKQVKCEVTHLSIQVKKSATIGRQIRIIEIPDCPITNMTQKSKKMCITVNEELSDMAERINKKLGTNCVKMIQCGEEELPQEEAYCDNKHFSPVRAAQLLEQIDESLKPLRLSLNNQRKTKVSTSHNAKDLFASVLHLHIRMRRTYTDWAFFRHMSSIEKFTISKGWNQARGFSWSFT